MSGGQSTGRLGVPIGLTLLLLGAQLTAVAPLSDPVSGAVPASLRLTVPLGYLALGPLFTLWDGTSMLSMSRLRGFLVGLVLLYLLWRIVRAIARPGELSWLREIGALLASVGLLLAFLFIGAVWHRPMLALSGADPGQVVVDFHSHTNVSHDVRNTLMRGFDTEANRRWHYRAGFDAVFITDHNTVAGLGARHHPQQKRPVICPGIEVSAWRSHIVLLGDSVSVDPKQYGVSLDGLLRLLRASDSAYGALSVASLPEYRRNLWDRLDTLAGAGLDGFEVVNASPKANEITRGDRDSVIQVARSRNRFVVGVSDSHGWGATSMVWNLVRTSGTPDGDPCQAVLRRLHDGFGAVRVIERHHLRPDHWWPLWLTPVGLVWESWRSMGWMLTGAWIVWIWGAAQAGGLAQRRWSASRSKAPKHSLANP